MNAATNRSSPAIELGLLGKQIEVLIKVFTEPSGSYYCNVRNEELPGSEMLTGEGDRRFMAYDSLPGTLNILALGIDAKNLFVELVPFDLAELRSLTLPGGVRIDDKGMWRGKRRLAASLRSGAKVEAEHGPRQLWTIPWKTLSDADLATAIFALDTIDEAGLYIEDASILPPVYESSIASTKPGLQMVQRLDLQFQLIQRQVPMLAIQLTTSLRLGMSLEVSQMLRFETWLNRNPEEAINRTLEDDPSPAGQEKVTSFIAFKMARDVRKAASAEGKEITWKEARSIVRKLLRRLCSQHFPFKRPRPMIWSGFDFYDGP